ncbi:sigma-E factor negative regulatory protein RseB [Chitinivorax tropicus]|uniref:Sigma-E factor negative regulatory protein RseB n=1 Tax=Chitinivorax tropicus TaxID=714531 RepID=A0A840MNE8_9PROT|nr:MucB/RseB C-terminal domain-containing protein [Chitinivorax tropicus]MBB5020168.1 sigma-E factor negative regulatory protein RseB [Chitinivorax tropicus]
MRVFLSVLLLSVASSVCVAETALSPADATALLKKISNAIRKQNYHGMYVYQHDGEVETFRMIHVLDGDNQLEKHESLDGPVREFVRLNDQINCYLPEMPANPVELRRRVSIKLFPALLPEDPSDIANLYHFKKKDAERVAGIDSAVLMMEPKDSLRYARKLWYDPVSGLLLRIGTYNSRQEPVEKFSFIQLDIGGQADRKALKPRFANKIPLKPSEMTVADNDNGRADAGFEIRPMPPGYRLIQEGKRLLGHRNVQVSHLMVGDGMAAISVFVEPVQVPNKTSSMMVNQGAINIYTRYTNDSRITALGDVPEAALKLIGSSVVTKPGKPQQGAAQ